jgi:hypothetical protein
VERSGTLGIQINMHTALKERKRDQPRVADYRRYPNTERVSMASALDRFFRSFRAKSRFLQVPRVPRRSLG